MDSTSDSNIIESVGVVRSTIAVDVGIEIASYVWRHRNIVRRFLDREFRKMAEGWGFTEKRERMLAELLGVNGDFHLRPGDDHLYGGPASRPSPGYPHDVRAIAAALGMFQKSWEIEDSGLIQEPILDADSVLCAGSPVSNSWTRNYLPVRKEETITRKTTQNAYQTTVTASQLPYHFLYGAREEIRVISAMHSGDQRLKRTHGVWVDRDREIWRPESYVDRLHWLERDFLLVSRLPRTLFGGEVLTVAGGHGAGTQAFELLFDPSAFPLDELEFLRSHLAGKQYYQFVLEACDIEHSGNAPSRAWKLAVSRRLLPVEITFGPDLFAPQQGLRRRTSTSSFRKTPVKQRPRLAKPSGRKRPQ